MVLGALKNIYQLWLKIQQDKVMDVTEADVQNARVWPSNK